MTFLRVCARDARRWDKDTHEHFFYPDQQNASWFQGSKNTFLSTQVLVQHHNLCCSAHVNFTAGAGARLALAEPS